MNLKYIEVLHIEDDIDHVDLVKSAALMAQLPLRISRVVDGLEALQFLRKEEPFADAMRPDLIILDLNSPRMDGLDALKAIRETSEAKEIPIVILTNRDLQLNVLKRNSLPYDCLYKKPVGINGYVEVMKAIEKLFKQQRFTLAPN